jgi:uncharacterized membrane protein
MDVRSQLHTDRARNDVVAWVDDLARYPNWMRLVHQVEPLPDDPRGAAWSVELRARLGPFARSKRLRMVRTRREPEQIVFERVERDGRDHASWVLTLDLADHDASGGGTRLDVTLHYGGSLWTGGVLERVLADEVDRGRDRLLSLLRER